jgi:hypothetical protein
MAKKLEYSYIYNKFRERDYTLVSTEYKSCKDKLLVMCPKEHECVITWSHFRKGHGCS